MSGGVLFDLLILDYGGVYSFEYDLGSFDTIMQNTFGKVPDAKERRVIEPFSHLLAKGQIFSHEYVLHVARILKVQAPSLEAFERNTIAVTHDPSPEMVGLVALAKKSGIKVALLSNMYMFEVIKTKPWGRYDNFDYVAFSAEAQMTKNDPDLFVRATNYLGIDPARTLFVDDVEENVRTAKKLGIRVIHADKNRFADANSLADSIREKLHIP